MAYYQCSCHSWSLNPLPKHPKKFLPKFDPDKDILPKDHIKQFMITLKLMNVQHDVVVFRLLCFTFQGKASSWFFSLASRSITSWQQFETAFMTQFGDAQTSEIFLLDISRININNREKVKEFNQRCIDILNRIPNKPIEAAQIEFYTVAYRHPLPCL